MSDLAMQHFGTLGFARDDMHAAAAYCMVQHEDYLPMMAADLGPHEVEENRNQ